MAQGHPQSVDDIIWVQTAFLGDIVLTTAALELAKEEFPNARQHLITTPTGAAALRGSPFLHSCTVFDKKGQSTLAAFRHVKRSIAALKVMPQRAVLLRPHRSARSALLCRYLGFYTITYRQSSLAFLADAVVDRISIFHEASRIAMLLEPLGIPREKIVGCRPRLPALPLAVEIDWQKQLADFSGRLIAVSPGSNWGTKRWPVESFSALAAHLSSEPNFGIILLGSDGERNLTEKIASACKTGNVWNLAGRTTLDDLRRIYPKLSLIVCNDSSPVHYGSAFNVPTLAIFGPTTPAQGFYGLAEGSRVAEVRGLGCRPCSSHGPETCPLGHFKCMKELSVAAVTELAETILG